MLLGKHVGKLWNIETRCCQWHPLTFEKQHVADDCQGLGVSHCSWDSLSIILSFTVTEFCRFQVFIFWFFTVKSCIFLSMLSNFLNQSNTDYIQVTTILKLIVDGKSTADVCHFFPHLLLTSMDSIRTFQDFYNCHGNIQKQFAI